LPSSFFLFTLSVSSEFDLVVIGSGFGGAMAAMRAVEMGKRVLMLERARGWCVDRRIGDRAGSSP
jgi:choline dehydrogenase-like flavoprotein